MQYNQSIDEFLLISWLKMQSSLKSFFTTKTSNTGSGDLQPPRPQKRKASEIDPERENNYFSNYDATKRCRKFQPHWKKEFPWLQYDPVKDIMWCDVCLEFCSKTKGGHSNKYVEGSNYFKLEAVRDHNKSKFHKDCMAIRLTTMNPKATPLAKIKLKLDQEQAEKYTMLFDTAFTVAKHNMSFRDFEVICKLQIKHNLNIGENYLNARACGQFIDAIAAVQRQDANEAICKSRFIAIMADGSTDRSVAEQEAVFIRYICDGVPVNRFIALVELESGNADGIIQAIDDALDLVGVDKDGQKSKVVNVNLDGASVNMGIHNGVAAKLQATLGPHLTKVHCINHQLELAILDIRKQHSYLGIFESTLKCIFSFYNHSPKCVRELEEIADAINVKLLKFGSVHQCSWVASQLRVVTALDQNYQAICKHFQAIIQEGAKDAAKVSGLLLRLRSPKFVSFLLFMKDFIQAITRLSQMFWRDDLLPIDVIPQIEVTMLQLVEMKTNPGPSIASLAKGNLYKGVDLSGEVEPDLADMHKEIITAAVDYMNERFQSIQQPPLVDFKIFNFSQWPYDRAELVKYGTSEVKRLLDQFSSVLSEEEVASAVDEWLLFKLHVVNNRTADHRLVYRDLLVQQP